MKMKLKRILLGCAAALISGFALAQTVLPPFITGINDLNKNSIFQMGIERFSRIDTLTATAGGTLANSAVLNAGMNIVSTVTTTNDSFTLPTLTGAVNITVVNGGANTLKVWPNVSTGQIDTAGAGVGKTVAANKMATFQQGADGLWYSVTSP
jgi:hypothetical protein